MNTALAYQADFVTQYMYAAIVPKEGDTYAQQVANVVKQIRQKFLISSEILRLTVFFRHPERLDEIVGLFKQHLAHVLPLMAYVAQAPADGSLITVEVTALSGAQIEHVHENLAMVRYDNLTFVHTHADALQGGRALDKNTYTDTLNVLNDNLRLLEQGGATLRDVFRTWFYMGDIVAPDERVADGIQRYKELNRARTDVFGDTVFLQHYLQNIPPYDVYPASTGIGTGGKNVALSCTALLTERADVYVVPLENPRQTAAFEYARHYSPETPKFSRAMAVIYDDQADLYVSGTASIIASETQHVGDVGRQTEETLLNIATLISTDNFAAAGFVGYGAKLTDLAMVRAYIKYEDDYAMVRQVCESQLQGVPVIYTIGDVCRDDLLVELEAVAHIQS